MNRIWLLVLIVAGVVIYFAYKKPNVIKNDIQAIEQKVEDLGHEIKEDAIAVEQEVVKDVKMVGEEIKKDVIKAEEAVMSRVKKAEDKVHNALHKNDKNEEKTSSQNAAEKFIAPKKAAAPTPNNNSTKAESCSN